MGMKDIMSLLYLSDILKKTGLDLSKTLLIRHALSDKECKQFYDLGKIKEYTQIQKKKMFPCPDRYKYWITFISDGCNSAVLDKCYQVRGYQEKSTNLVPKKFIDDDWFCENGICFDLEEIDILRTENRATGVFVNYHFIDNNKHCNESIFLAK